MKVVFSFQADADVAGIEAYIARDNAVWAASFTDELIAACAALTDLPFGAPSFQAMTRPDFAGNLTEVT